MTEGYGNRIYVKKSKRFNPWPYVAIILVLVSAWFFFSWLKKGEPMPEPLGAEAKANARQEQTAAKSMEEGQTPQATQPEIDPDELLITAEERALEIDTSPESFAGEVETTPTGKSPAKPGKNNPVKFSKANILFKQGKFREALPLYEELADSNFAAMALAGACHYFLEDYTNALSYLERALDNNNRSFPVIKYYALTCYKLDNLDKSREYAEKGLEMKADQELQWLHDKLKREKRVMRYYGEKKRVHFNIRFSKFEHQESKELVSEILEEAYRVIGQQINFYPSEPITVILYNEKGFFDVTRAPGWAGGLYDGKIRLPVKGVEGQEEMLKRILFHEYVHALVHAITPECPLWLNEGLAEYFSRGENEYKVGQLIPLQHLEKRFPSGDVRLVAAAYIESYSVVCHLIEKHALYRVKDLLEALGRGNSLRESFKPIFFISYDRFLETWGKEE
jgi:hypothetical protein